MKNDLLKSAKASHKEALKNKILYKQRRDELVMKIVESEIPAWGGIRVLISKI